MEQGWKRKFLYNWYNISVYIAGILIVCLAIGNWDTREKMLLGAAAFIFLHFFEEFGFPGGFAPMGLKVEMHNTDPDPAHWSLNQLNSLIGNWYCAVIIYILPLFFPNVRFMTLAAAIFGFIEVFGHLIMFNIACKKIYNPGLFTALFGLMPISMWYFSTIWGQQLFRGVDIVLAIAWIGFNYWLAFRSPIYKKLGAMSDRYAFTPEEVKRGEEYLR
ncbi:MAG: HXXEE domain-containing protein [Huintestinicola sp.]